mgnify:FL=1
MTALGPRQKVAGSCPVCGSRSLFIASGDYVTCGYLQCPDPTFVADLLVDHCRVRDHIVNLGDTSFSIQHPVRERRDGELFDCGLHAWLNRLTGPPRVGGRYRVVTPIVRDVGVSPDWAQAAWVRLPDGDR